MAQASRPFDFSIRDELLRDPKCAAIYLAEMQESGITELIEEAHRAIAKAQSTDVEKKAG